MVVLPKADAHVKEGELVDLIDEFSDGRVQFALTKVKDPNTALPKNVLIGWVRVFPSVLPTYTVISNLVGTEKVW